MNLPSIMMSWVKLSSQNVTKKYYLNTIQCFGEIWHSGFSPVRPISLTEVNFFGLQWSSEKQTCRVLKWLTSVWNLNSPKFNCHFETDLKMLKYCYKVMQRFGQLGLLLVNTILKNVVQLWVLYIDLVYVGADSITLKWFNKVLYKLRYYSINDKKSSIWVGCHSKRSTIQKHPKIWMFWFWVSGLRIITV